MTDQPPSIHVNLAVLQASLLTRLQHLLDMLAVSILGAEAADETKYSTFSRFFNVSPAQLLRKMRAVLDTELSRST